MDVVTAHFRRKQFGEFRPASFGPQGACGRKDSPTAAAFPLQLPKRGDQPPPPGELKGWGEGVAVPSGF